MPLPAAATFRRSLTSNNYSPKSSEGLLSPCPGPGNGTLPCPEAACNLQSISRSLQKELTSNNYSPKPSEGVLSPCPGNGTLTCPEAACNLQSISRSLQKELNVVQPITHLSRPEEC